jgi:hypothetical protein
MMEKELKGGYIPTRGMGIAKLALRCVQIVLGVVALALAGSISFGMGNVGGLLPFVIVSPPVSLMRD